jgi:hypothetical protein
MTTMHKQFKMADVMDTHMKQTVVNKFLTAEEVSPTEIYRCLNSRYVEHTTDVSTVRRWVKTIASVFWDKERIMLVDFLKKGATINSEQHKETLNKLQQHICRICPN